MEERVCEMCQDGSVEDEEHFILKCNKYTTERNELFRTIGITGDEENILEWLTLNATRSFAKFLVRIWETRKENIYKS